MQLLIHPFTKNQASQASELLLKSESRSQNTVLVSVRSLKELRDAYPSYFGNTEEFINIVRRVVAV